MNRELDHDLKVDEFTAAVQDAIGYRGGSPRLLLRLVCEQLTTGEARDFLAWLNAKGRDSAAWEDGWILGMVNNLMEDEKYDCITYGDAAEIVSLHLGNDRSQVLKRLKERGGPQLQLLRKRREQKLLGNPKLKAKGKRQFKRLMEKTKKQIEK